MNGHHLFIASWAVFMAVWQCLGGFLRHGQPTLWAKNVAKARHIDTEIAEYIKSTPPSIRTDLEHYIRRSHKTELEKVLATNMVTLCVGAVFMTLQTWMFSSVISFEAVLLLTILYGAEFSLQAYWATSPGPALVSTDHVMRSWGAAILELAILTWGGLFAGLR